MKSLLLASAVLLLSGPFAYADNPSIANDNDHNAALGFIIEHNAAALSSRTRMAVVTATYRSGAIMPTGTNFLRYRANGDNK